MTNKEALNILYKGVAPNPTENNECIKLCKKAIERQIPKKPYVKYPKEKEWMYCTCGSYMCDIGKETKPRFCKYCGQMLDWSDDNAEVH